MAMHTPPTPWTVLDPFPVLFSASIDFFEFRLAFSLIREIITFSGLSRPNLFEIFPTLLEALRISG